MSRRTVTITGKQKSARILLVDNVVHYAPAPLDVFLGWTWGAMKANCDRRGWAYELNVMNGVNVDKHPTVIAIKEAWPGAVAEVVDESIS